MQDRICENCGRWIERNEVLYEMTITIQAEAGAPVELEDAEDGADFLDEIQKLVEKMENMNEGEVEDATDQVHESYEFALCPECRQVMHKRLRRRRGFMEAERSPPHGASPMQALRSFVLQNNVTVIGLCVLVLFLGIGISVKMDTKWGYVVAFLAVCLALYTLKVNGVFNL
jgi:hypothetical protein